LSGTPQRPGNVWVDTSALNDSEMCSHANELRDLCVTFFRAAFDRGLRELVERVYAMRRARRLPLAKVTSFEARVGRGVVGKIDGVDAALGNQRLMAELNIDCAALTAKADALRHEGQTVVFIAQASRAIGLLGIADPVKTTTPEALTRLRGLGVHVVMLTGDEATAIAVARRLAIDEVHADVLPEQKDRVVTALQADGKIVAMAGDGTNDAPHWRGPKSASRWVRGQTSR
jgi:Cu+-exporting ATPase